MRCASCQKDLEEGTDVIGVREGVIGNRDFVPLEESLLLCSKECLRNYFSNSKGYVERIP